MIDANPECFVPPIPPNVTGAGAGTEEDDKKMKERFQRWFDKICRNPILIRDEEVVLLVESDFGYSPLHGTRNSQHGLRRKALKQYAPPPDDCLELVNSRPLIKAFYKAAGNAQSKLERVEKAQRALATSCGDLGIKLGAISAHEPHAGLANGERKLGKAIQTVADLTSAYGTTESVTFGDALRYAESSAFIAKETLTTRHILMREYISAQTATKSREATAKRLQSGNKIQPAKVDEAINLLQEAREHESNLQTKVSRVTNNLLQEKELWVSETAADLKIALREYIFRSIEHERRVLATLESVRPDIRAIDASGGLSRLGRESTFAKRVRGMSNAGPSQGRDGDAWSGLPRRISSVDPSVHLVVASLEEQNTQETNEDDQSEAPVQQHYTLDAKSAATLLSTF